MEIGITPNELFRQWDIFLKGKDFSYNEVLAMTQTLGNKNPIGIHYWIEHETTPSQLLKFSQLLKQYYANINNTPK